MEKKQFCKTYRLTEKQFTGQDVIVGYLDLDGLTSIPDGFNPTVGGGLYLRGRLTCSTRPLSQPILPPTLAWQNGRYMKVDGIFVEVIRRRGNICHVKKIHSDRVFYMVTNGNHWAHGDTLKQAKEDLLFKIDSEKIKSEPIYPDTYITDNHYRIITGACRYGIEQWKKDHKIKGNRMKAKTLLPLLEKTDAYGIGKFKELYNQGGKA